MPSSKGLFLGAAFLAALISPASAGSLSLLGAGPASGGAGGGGGGGGGTSEGFFTTATPTYTWNSDSPIEVGMRFIPNTNGRITGVRFYKDASDTGTHVGNLWTTAGVNLGTVTFSGETTSGWQTASFGTPISVTASTTYVVSVHKNTGFSSTNNDWNVNTYSSTHAGIGTEANDWFSYGAGGFPSSSSTFAANFWVDFIYTTP